MQLIYMVGITSYKVASFLLRELLVSSYFCFVYIYDAFDEIYNVYT